MKLRREEVEHIAELAKLDLTDAEIEMYAEQLSDILSHVDELSKLDTSAIPPTASVLPLRNVTRQDDVQPSLPSADALANTAQAADDQFRVAAVLGDEGE